MLSGGIDRRDAMQVLMKNSGKVQFSMLSWYSRGGFGGGSRRIGIRAVRLASHSSCGREEDMQRFHFFDGKFLGRWYPKGLTAKRMVRYSKGLLNIRGCLAGRVWLSNHAWEHLCNPFECSDWSVWIT